MNKLELYVLVYAPPQLFYAAMMSETAKYMYPHVQTGKSYIGMPVILVPKDWSEWTGWTEKEVMDQLQNKAFIDALTQDILQWLDAEKQESQNLKEFSRDEFLKQ